MTECVPRVPMFLRHARRSLLVSPVSGPMIFRTIFYNDRGAAAHNARVEYAMHELSIALDLIDVAVEQARDCSARVAAVHLRLGLLSGVVKDALTTAYEAAREGTLLEAASLIIEDVPVEIYCPTCHASRPAVSLQQLSCVQCGTPAAEMVRGREIEVVALEINESEAPTSVVR